MGRISAPPQKSLTQVYVCKTAADSFGLSTALPAAVPFPCHNHTIQSPFQQKHRQLSSLIPGKSYLERSGHQHPLILTLTLLPLPQFAEESIEQLSQSVSERSVMHGDGQLPSYPE